MILGLWATDLWTGVEPGVVPSRLRRDDGWRWAMIRVGLWIVLVAAMLSTLILAVLISFGIGR